MSCDPRDLFRKQRHWQVKGKNVQGDPESPYLKRGIKEAIIDGGRKDVGGEDQSQTR